MVSKTLEDQNSQSSSSQSQSSSSSPSTMVSMQAGKSKLVLSIAQTPFSYGLKVVQSTPDITEVGSTLEEAKLLRHTHDELTLKFNSKRLEALSSVSECTNEVRKSAELAWEDAYKRLESRKALLEQSVSFHNSVQQFLKKLQEVETKCVDVHLSQDVNKARADLQHHQDLKKSVLEASMMTLQEGQLLLDKIRKAALECGPGWSRQRHATTSGCYYIEQLLVSLRFRKLRLDELWSQRKVQLEQCVKFMVVGEEVARISKWLESVIESSSSQTSTELGETIETSVKLFRECQSVEDQASPFPQKLKLYLGTLDFIFSACPILGKDIDAMKDTVQSLEGKLDNLLSKLDTRRRNLGLILCFHEYSFDALARLEGLKLMRDSLDHTTSLSSGGAWLDGWKHLQRGVQDATIAAIYYGNTLLTRVGRDDPNVACVVAKLTTIEETVNKLLSNLPQALVAEVEKDANHQLEEKLYKLNSWFVLIGQSSTNKFNRLTVNLHEVNEFLVYHRLLAEDNKQMEAKQLLATAKELVKPATNQTSGAESGGDVTDQSASSLVERCEKLEKHFENLRELLEKRSKLALSFIVLQKRERQLSAQLQLLEEQLRDQVTSSSVEDLTDATIRHRENAVKKLNFDLTEFDKIGKQFVADANELKSRDHLNVDFVLNAVTLILGNFEERKGIIVNHFDGWKEFVDEWKDSRTRWKQLLVDGRKTIDWIIKVEDNFFPKLAGELGSSLPEVLQHQKRLEDFKNIIQKVQDETEQHLKSAELLSAKYDDSHGSRDFIVNELHKTYTRFQARIVEYKHLLDVSKLFFENLSQLDTLIDSTEKEYTAEQLPSNVQDAKEALRSHHCNRNKLTSSFEGRSREADDIIVRVRQQDAQEMAKDEIRKILQQSESRRSKWDKMWDEHKNKLEQGLLLCQFYFDLKQLQSELDLLQRQLDQRQGCYGNTAASVQAILQAFAQLKTLADAIGGRVAEFMSTAEKMIKDGHYDSRRIKHEVDETSRKWKTFYDSLNKYKACLDENVKFYKLHDESEGWIQEASQFLLSISKKAPQCKSSEDVETLVKLVVSYRSEGGQKQDGRLKEMEVLVTDLYGSVSGPEKMSHILSKTQDVYNAFIRAIEELRILQRNLVNTEHILASVEAVVEKKAPKQPKFVLPLQNAELAEGQRFTFECRLECDTTTPRIEWLKDDEPAKGFPTSFRDGLCQLTIEETLVSDSGKYSCKCTTEGGTAMTSAMLRVKEGQPKVVAPELLRHLRAAEVPEGTSHTFECHVTGLPTPQITWYKDEILISLDSPDYVIDFEQGRCTLKIKKLNKQLHTAKYKMKACNQGGEVVTTATLNVLSVRKPEFTRPLRDQAVDEGKSVKLECGYLGEPAPQIQWTFNDTPILPSSLFKITITDTTTSLEIKEIFSEDCGTYAVTAKNMGGEAQTSCLIALLTHETRAQLRMTRAAEKPRFISPLKDGEAKEGERARFECIVLGYPDPEIAWFHNGKPIKQTKDFDFTHDPNTGKCTLIIHELYLEDTGVYLCQAKNELGSDTTVAKLRVIPAPIQVAPSVEVDEVPPKFTQLLKDIEGTEGDLVKFECRVIGHPAPVIKWFFGRNQIENCQEFQITSEREVQILTIPNLHKHDAGNFMVKATNNAGIAKCYATLLVKPKSDTHAMKMRLVESSHSVQTDLPVQAGHVPPEIIKSFHDIHVRPGQPCTMEVVIGGRPKPKIQWLFNNEPITNNVYKIATFGDVHSLHIPQVYDEDVGRFSVIAENEAGKAWCSALLVVVDSSQLVGEADSPPETPHVGQRSAGLDYGPPPVVQPRKVPPPKLPDLPPKFFAGLRDLTSEIDKPLNLEVIVEGRPEPLITWYKNVHEELSENPNFEISCRDGRARLVILKPKLSDSGEYTCVAKNHLGQVQSTATIVIKAPATRPRFLEKLQPTTTANEGHPVRLVVFTSGEPAPKVVWYKEGVEIMPSPDFIITDEGNKHTLLIPEAFPEDSGKYGVKVFNGVGEEYCSTALTVNAAPKKAPQVAPKFVKPLHNKSVTLGQRVTLECCVPTELRPERVDWYHNDHYIVTNQEYFIDYKPETGVCLLIIERVTTESRGRYVCTIVVNGVQKSTAMDLEVVLPPQQKNEKPKFVEQLRNQIADEGSDVQLWCRIQGHPRPIITWYHNGRPIRPSSRHAQKFNPNDWTVTLIIVGATNQDAGIYTCSASNDAGQEYTSSELKVRVKSPVPPRFVAPAEPVEQEVFKSREIGGVAEQYFRPVFKKVPADLQISEGHVARFDCVVLGRPTPDVYWFREGIRVQEDRMHKIVINEEGVNSLIFEAVTPEDGGLYLCIARNRAGEDRFNVSLNVLPRRSMVPPKFGSRLPNQTVILGQPVTFTVDIDGIPQPTVTWQKNDQPISSGEKYRISGDGYRSTLYIPFVTMDDNAWFQCVASSSTGTSVNKFRLTVEDKKKTEIRKSPSPIGQRSISVGRHSPAVIQSSLIFSPTEQLLHSKRTTSETTLRTVHTGSIKSPIESVPAPKLIEPMKDQLLNVGGTAHFRCKIHSTASVTHQWFFETTPISRNWSSKYRSFEGPDGLYGLDINDVTDIDAGIYKCVVENRGGEVTCIAHLRVGAQPPSKMATRVHATPSPIPFIMAPHIVRPLTDFEAEVGGSANFEVVFSGPPMSRVEWFLDGRKIIEGMENFKVSQTSNGASLRVDHVSENMAGGKVQCVASNDSGNVESSATLHVKSGAHYFGARPQQSPFPGTATNLRPSKSPVPFPQSSATSGHAPEIVKHLENVVARDGSQVLLSCHYQATDPVQVSWFHNQKSIDNSPDYAINVDRNNLKTELVIVDCMLDDAGTFKCVIKNNFGRAESSCQLQVVPPHHQQPQVGQYLSSNMSDQNQTSPQQDEVIKHDSAKPLGASKPTQQQINLKSQTQNEGKPEEKIIPRYSPRYYAEPPEQQPQQHDDNIGAPKFAQPIQPCVAVEGETLDFTAFIQSHPDPRVEWYKEKQLLYPDSRHVILADKASGRYSLRILGCSQMFDAGVYSCHASNLNGKATCSANAVVVRK